MEQATKIGLGAAVGTLLVGGVITYVVWSRRNAALGKPVTPPELAAGTANPTAAAPAATPHTGSTPVPAATAASIDRLLLLFETNWRSLLSQPMAARQTQVNEANRILAAGVGDAAKLRRLRAALNTNGAQLLLGPDVSTSAPASSASDQTPTNPGGLALWLNGGGPPPPAPSRRPPFTVA